MSNHHLPYGSEFEIDYHREAQVRRAERAFKAISPGDVLAQVDDLIAREPDPTQHPMYQLTLFLLDRATAVDGAKLYDDCRRLVLSAINVCLDEALERGDD